MDVICTTEMVQRGKGSGDTFKFGGSGEQTWCR